MKTKPVVILIILSACICTPSYLYISNVINNSLMDELKLIEHIQLDVPFISQYPPGTGWADTKNCGQASFLMVYCYHKGLAPSTDDIIKIDDWLYEHLEQEVREYNGSGTHLTEIKKLAKGYGGMKAEYHMFYNYKKLIKSLKENKPVIVSIYYPSPGNPVKNIYHASVVTGIDKNFVYLNDPGRSKGKNYKMSIVDFNGYWQSCMREVLIVENKR
jgi:ABC-type bacteriocin/lantibiotic exporter with double-glycine peptidase domain